MQCEGFEKSKIMVPDFCKFNSVVDVTSYTVRLHPDNHEGKREET